MEHQHKIVFGTDGIRGIAGQFPLDQATQLQIGRAIGTWLREKKGDSATALIGCDTRQSSSGLTQWLASGLMAEGISPVDAGVVSTPGLAYLTRCERFALGIVISASHNPFEQNGIKLIGPDGFKLPDDDERAIEDQIERLLAGEYTPSGAQLGQFQFETGRYLREYVSFLASTCKAEPLDNLCIVLDCANGAGFDIAPNAFRQAGTRQLVRENVSPNGVNINVRAGSEFVRRDRSAILGAIQDNQADLGIAFDGDADRVVFVTPEGMLIDGDHILGILALDLKARNQLTGDTVVATDMSNSGLEHFLREHGIALRRTRVGDRYVMDEMRKNGFVLGGEQAGHVILLQGDHTIGDGIFIGLLVASIVAHSKRSNGPTLHELAARIPRYPQVIASAHLNRQISLDAVPGLADLRRETLELFDHKGRVNMRFSGTEPNLLRTMIEGGPGTSMAQVVERALALSKQVADAVDAVNPKIDLVDCATGAPVQIGS